MQCNKVFSILKKSYLSELLHFCYCHKQIVQGEFWIGLHLLSKTCTVPCTNVPHLKIKREEGAFQMHIN